MKSLSLSNMTLSSNLWLATIVLIKIYAISLAIVNSICGKKYTYLVSLHSLTRIELY